MSSGHHGTCSTPSQTRGTLPLWSGFCELAYQAVRAIPKGRVATYGSIARHIPPPHGVPPDSYEQIRARWVGYALARCPSDVPWHRVVNSRGYISPRNLSPPSLQRILLEEEGVIIGESGRIDLNRYGHLPSGSLTL